VLYIAGEESASQIKIRAERLKVKTENLLVLEETDVDEVLSHLSELRSLSLTIIDSVQTLTTQDLNGTAGSVGQVRECAARLIRAAKQAGTPLFLVGHVTKEGAIAGPKVLEHAVDTVLNFEGDRYQDLRLVRAAKNRFGPTDEVGIFRMTDSGLQPEADLHGFTAETTGTTDAARVGSCLTVIMEGTRPILLEIQALTTATPLPAPRRVGSGVDYNRLQMIVAVLQKRLNLPLYKEDIYVNVSGGIAIREPAGDLACALAILSSYRSKPLPAKTIAVGEIDLLGGVRGVNSLERRIKEARGLGYKNILSAGNLRNLQDFKF
jgi:DNA repair protein RadA/Sms